MSLRCESPPVVNFSRDSSLVGRVVYGREKLRPVYEFVGVPFAQPPQRFQPPEPLLLWSGQRDATEHGPICPQDRSHYEKLPVALEIPKNQSEDCLYLNIWTSTLDPGANLPVIVWIHGGAFLFGYGHLYQGTALSSHEDVVFVSINYRLGPFGFMTTGDAVAPGNYGIMDQIEALRWTQKYISLFGGDPDNVTVCGQSAGGVSVSILLLCEAARGLFKRAISQSGTANASSFFLTQRYLAGCVREHLRGTEYEVASNRELIGYLQTLPADELVSRLGDQFRPVVDGILLKDFSIAQYQKPDGVEAADYMMGSNSHEAFTFLMSSVKQESINDRASATPLVMYALKIAGGAKTEEDATLWLEAVFHEYFKGVSDGDRTSIFQRLVQLYSDIIFVVPMAETAHQHSKKAPTYIYKFLHRPSFCQAPGWVLSDHGMEAFFMLGAPLGNNYCPKTFTEEERRLSKEMMAYWANFVRTGNPNGDGLPHWPQYSYQSSQHLAVQTTSSFPESMNSDRVRFWQEMATKHMRDFRAVFTPSLTD